MKITSALLSSLYLVSPFHVMSNLDYPKHTPGFGPDPARHGNFAPLGSLPVSGCYHPSRGALFRGGAPKEAKAIQKLVEHGVSFVVDLRTEDTAARRQEAQALDREDIVYINLPISTDSYSETVDIKIYSRGMEEVFSDIPQEVALQAVALVSKKMLQRGRSGFVHCARGEDRTGAFIAALRQQRPSEETCTEWRREFSGYGGTMYSPLKKVLGRLGIGSSGAKAEVDEAEVQQLTKKMGQHL